MSLLETRNKKFNVPFIFIAGVIFLFGLAYFANYIENLGKDAIDLELPKTTESETNSTSITVRLAKGEITYLDSTQINSVELKENIKIKLDGQPNPTILLHADEDVSIDKVVDIMEFANKNTYKVILGVRSK
ncbi:ExbD/TolR family protein [Kordia jejudonensis]|uniref:ExbD/TolR family protein n=1 Tax=Kordia jejudonensis TaxID=1348245 RepID=UPI00069B4893|nr:biopolymer transporter ExbD [Kordia jejudonensis]